MQLQGMLEIDKLGVVFHGTPNVEALRDVSFAIESGRICCVIGTSGCGKSTLLKAIAGFLTPTCGEIRLNGRLIDGAGPDRGVVFQHHALFPWLTVERNVEYGLRMRGVECADRKKRVHEMLSKVGLHSAANRYPGTLSGGMQQRVGLARVLVNDPEILLMDEPFGALDAETRLNMQELLLRVHEESPKTIVFVTHDVDEAILLGDEIFVLSAAPGRIIKRILIDQPRPRSWEFMMSRLFLDTKKEALELIRFESRASLEDEEHM